MTRRGTVGTVQPGMMLEVINVNGPWLWVGRGWVAEADVIPMNKALAFYGQQIDAGPAYFPLACRSRVLYESRQYDRAIADCDEALRLDPAGTAALAMRARALARVGRHKEGLTNLEEALRIDPKCGVAYAGRGHIWLELDESSNALEDFARAIEFDPKSAWTYGGRGRAFARQGEFDKAIDDFSAALKLNPHLRAVWNNRGNVWFKKGDFSHAVADFSAALQIAPSAQIYYNRAGLGAPGRRRKGRAGFGEGSRNRPEFRSRAATQCRRRAGRSKVLITACRQMRQSVAAAASKSRR